MTNNTSPFTPSTQILDAAEQAKALVDAGNALKPFFSPEIQETVDGVDKIAKAMNATGVALRHFGFDEAEPEVTTSEVDLIPTDDLQIVDNMNPTFGELVPDSLRPSTYVIEGGQALQENGWKGTGEAIENAGQVMRAFGFDEAEADGLTGTGPAMPAFELNPRFFIGGGPAPIDIEPGDPIFQEIAELLRASKPEADGLTGTGPAMPAFDEDELTGTGPAMPAFDEDERMKPSDALKESAAIVGAAGGIAAATGVGAPAAAGIAAYSGVLYLSGTIVGAFGYDVDESEPYIPEVGVDALA